VGEKHGGAGPGETIRLHLVVNQRRFELLVPPHRTLLEVLREDRDEIRHAISGNLCRCT
jgi:aerobic-type carbon monoxide dehydrogenase small subunit (CoxS/CutS family)